MIGPYELDSVTCADALAFLAALPDACADAVVTDPPYGIGYASSWTTRNNGDTRTTPGTFGADEFDAAWLPECARVLKDGGALYLFTRWDVLNAWKDAIEASGLHVAQRIVWDKSHWGMGDLRYFGSQTEDILFAVKGVHALRWPQRAGNVWRDWKGLVWQDGYEAHPTQKPVRIMKRAIRLSTDPGALVIDPFAGSGTTGVAARSLGRHFLLNDITPEYVRIARDRLAAPYTPPLFVDDAPAQRAEQQSLLFDDVE